VQKAIATKKAQVQAQAQEQLARKDAKTSAPPDPQELDEDAINADVDDADDDNDVSDSPALNSA